MLCKKKTTFIYLFLLTEIISERFTIGRRLGRGGSAEVFAAVRKSDGEKVSVGTFTAEHYATSFL